MCATPVAAETEPTHARSWRLALNVLLALVAVLLLTRTFVAEPLRVGASSMTPTLRPGDHVLVVKLGSSAHHPHRHDVIALTSPITGELLIKRVAAVGGDTVGIEDGVLVVNGRPVHESYVDAARMDSVYFGPVVVPRGELFVLGDDRPDSVDSRRFGAIPLRAVTGRVVLRLWPRP
jgi:signal peptidase I